MNLLHYILKLFVLMTSLFLLSCDRQENRQTANPTEPMPKYQRTIIAVGDSLTAGLGVAEDDAWPAIVEKRLHQDGHNWQIINGGISGETSSGTLSRIKWILAQKPDIVIIETGANDGLRGIRPSVVMENIRNAVQMLRDGNVEVVLAGMQIVQNLGADYAKEFAEVYPAVAGEMNCVLIPFFLEGVAGEPSLNQADAIHPNVEGHKIISETVYPYVLQAMQHVNSN